MTGSKTFLQNQKLLNGLTEGHTNSVVSLARKCVKNKQNGDGATSLTCLTSATSLTYV